MASKGKNAANLLKAFRNESLETLSKGFGKFSDDEAKLFAEVKGKLSGDDLKSFIKDMSDARHQNAVNHAKSLDAQNQAYLDKGYSQEYKNKDYIERKAERTQKYNKTQGENAYNKYHRQLNEARPASNTPQPPPEIPAPDYAGAKGRKDYYGQPSGTSNRRDVSNGPAEIVPYTDPAEAQAKFRKEAFDYNAKEFLRRQELNNANKTGWERFVDKGRNRVAASGFNSSTTASRRDYNEFLYSQGKTNYVKTNREFQRMTGKLGINGTYQGTAEGLDAMQRAQKGSQRGIFDGLKEKAAETMDKAGEIASETNFMEYLGQAWDWATQDTQHALMVAGGAVGVGILGAEILEDDDGY